MPLPLTGDRVQETTAVVGLGPATLLGAVAGWRSFSAAVGTGVQCYYAIEHTEVGAWEVGEGHLTDATTLARDRVASSSTGGAPVSFAAGTKRVYATIPAETVNRRWHREVPAGAVNGVNATFTLSAAPAAAESLTVWVNGLAQRSGAGNDFTLAGAVLTFLAGAVPQAGDGIEAEYLA
jgi:hypothetical protein